MPRPRFPAIRLPPEVASVRLTEPAETGPADRGSGDLVELDAVEHIAEWQH